jgi:hypothetical protein
MRHWLAGHFRGDLVVTGAASLRGTMDLLQTSGGASGCESRAA